MSAQSPVYLLDASIYIFRAYFSLPENWHSPEGYPLNAVYGYCSFLLDLLRRLERGDSPVLAACFDESLGSCYRNDFFPAYKSSREHPDAALAFQLEQCRGISESLGLACYSGERFEADDFIATLARQARESSQPVTIVTRDKDLGQLLLREQDRLWDFSANVFTGRAEFAEKFGVAPEQFTDYQALVGDAVDGIPGVPGIGAKSAAAILGAFRDLEELSSKFDQLNGTDIRGATRIAKNLQEHWSDALVSRNLARLADRIDGIVLPQPYRATAACLREMQRHMRELGLTGPVLQRCEHMAVAAERQP